MSCNVAFIGLGVMGYPMAGYISKGGHNVTVFNRTKSKAEKWISEYKGKMAETPAEAAKDAEYIFTCVGNDNDLREVTLDSAILDGTDLSNTNLEDSFAYSTQFENVKIQGADFTNVFLPKDIVRKFCESASGTNPFTNRDTRETLECDYI